jgi:enoyl-CoA hydratase/3-hydroxyacyl-CoA dehydrogenase
MRSPIEEISTICYVGAGTMGCVNALVAAVSGYDVVLYDIEEATLASVETRQRGFADHMVAIGYCTAEEAAAALALVRTTSDAAEAAAGADLVSESVAENVEIKRRVHAHFDRLCGPSTILTTNTSNLLVSDIDVAVERGERFAALHSHLGSPLWDIVPGPRTAPDVLGVLERFVLSLGGEPLVLRREYRGYVVNGLIGALTRSALSMLIRGDASASTIDRSWMLHQSAPIGPFGLLDLFGIDIVADNMSNNTSPSDDSSARSTMLALLNAKVDAGTLGMKSGSGFYEYPDPAYGRADFCRDEVGTEPIHRVLLGAVLHRAAHIAADEVADPSDIDRAWKSAMGLAAGPFESVRLLGARGLADASLELIAMGLVTPAEADRAQECLTSDP